MILVLALPAEVVLPALAMFRVIYYLLPLGVALAVLTIDEFYQRRHVVGQWGNAFGTLTMAVAPKLLAVFMMLGGAVLMFSGATPTAAGRLAWVNAFVPAAGHRAVALRRQPRRLRAARRRVGAGAAARRGLRARLHRARRRHRRVAAEGRRLRGGARAVGAARGALRQPRGVRSQGGAVRHPVLADMGRLDARGRGRDRSASVCLRSATSSGRRSCGGASRSIRTRRASCARPSAS